MTLEERAKLAKECEEADFRVPHNEKKTQVQTGNPPPFPCVYVIPEKSRAGHHGLPILAQSGGKSTSWLSVLQLPTDQVAKTHNGKVYIYMNKVTLFCKTCDTNEVKLKVRVEDLPGNF